MKESGGERAWPLIMTWRPDKRAVNTQAAKDHTGLRAVIVYLFDHDGRGHIHPWLYGA